MRKNIKHTVIIGDIVASKKVKNRKTVQAKLDELLRKINYRRKDIVSKYTITLGDEFQAVYSDANRLFEDVFRIRKELYPAHVRIAVSVGRITTTLKPKALGMDGPAFYNARETITSLKKTRKHLMISLQGKENKLFNTSVELVGVNNSKWRLSRLKVFLSLLEGKSIEKISGELKISERAVYKSIDTGALQTHKKLLEIFTSTINKQMSLA